MDKIWKEYFYHIPNQIYDHNCDKIVQLLVVTICQLLSSLLSRLLSIIHFIFLTFQLRQPRPAR